MRLSAFLMALAAAAPAASAGPGGLAPGAPVAAPFGTTPVFASPSPSGGCPPISRFHATQRDPTPRAQKLTELPAADAYRAAYRTIDNCEVPIVARYGIGTAGSK